MILGGKVVQEATYPHAIERVWDALVDPEQLAEWLMPNDFLPILGRRFTMSCGPLGLLEGEVVELDAPRRLAYRWVGGFGETLVTYTLTPVAGGTHLRVEHQGWTDGMAEVRKTFESGWTEKFADALPRVLSRAGNEGHAATGG